MTCATCGAENRKGAAFCTTCGKALKRAPRRKRREKPAGRSGVKKMAVLFSAGVITLAVVILRMNGTEGTRPDGQTFDVAVQATASRFFCGCGTCDVPELTDCTCPTAVEEKTFIDRELKGGASEQQVVRRVNRRYGRIKPRYAYLIGDGAAAAAMPDGPQRPGATKMPARLDPPNDLSDAPSGTPAVSASPVQRIATEADTLEIASRFICACGQCRDQVLAECDCDHPRGAVEMKAFIRYKISQKRYRPEEIIQATAYEYGHLIEK